MKTEASIPNHDERKSLDLLKWRGVFWFFSGILSILLSLLFFFIVGFHREYQNIQSKHSIGNRTSNVKALKEKGFPFSFLVVSDTHNSHRMEALLRAALKNGDASFLIHLGDFVYDPVLWDHRYFLTKMAMDIKPPFPIFLAPGNHDIDYRSKKEQNNARMTPELFESFYGARRFDFTFNNCLFILCEVDLRNPTAYLDFLQDVLSKKGKGKKYIFVFRHYAPPKLVDYRGGGALPNEDKFFNLVESYKVTTCFFGHYHGYRRGQINGVSLIVLGGGGGRLKSWQSEWGKFHHLLKINVDEHTIIEDMMVLDNGGVNFSGTIKKWVFISFFPIMKDRIWIPFLGAILFLVFGIYSFVCFAYSFKKKEVIKNL